MATTVTTAVGATATEASPGARDDLHDDVDLVDEELLVEEISIDGMCGVY